MYVHAHANFTRDSVACVSSAADFLADQLVPDVNNLTSTPILLRSKIGWSAITPMTEAAV